MKIAVVGGGVSGMMAAISASKQNASVALFEKNEKLGKKMYITGKGRCNLTNNCLPDEFLSNVVSNAKFLQGAIHRFSPQSTLDFCAENGLQLKTERGNRVFPASDKSSDVIRTFASAVKNSATEVRLNTEVTDISPAEGGFWVSTAVDREFFHKVVVACGGFSYRSTGSDGFGYRVAEKFSHKIVPLKPALCKILCTGTQSLEGLSLKNVTVSFVGEKCVEEFGEMLFTKDGVSGPAVLSLSSRINRLNGKNAKISVDLKPALDEEKLDARLLRDFGERMNKNFINSLDALLPQRLVEVVATQSGIPFDRKVNSITAAQRKNLVHTLKNLTFPFVGLDDVNFAIVTAGGVDVRQINPSTMESKLHKGLYFVGEELDVDAFTGGFNIQIALSTGFVAGTSAAKEKV